MAWHWTQILAARGRRQKPWAIARPWAEFRQTLLCQSIKIPYESTHSCYITDVIRVTAHLDKQETTGVLKDRIHNLLLDFFCIANRWLHGTQTSCCNMANKSAKNQQHSFFFINYYLGEKLHMICNCNEVYIYMKCIFSESQSQWPRCLKRRSEAARLLRMWVRIPPGARMSVSCECCVLSGTGFCDKLITRPEESYRLWCVVVCNLETSWMRRPWPTGAYRAKPHEWGGHGPRWAAAPKERKKCFLKKYTFGMNPSLLVCSFVHLIETYKFLCTAWYTRHTPTKRSTSLHIAHANIIPVIRHFTKHFMHRSLSRC